MRDWKQGFGAGNFYKNVLREWAPTVAKETIHNRIVELVLNSYCHLEKRESHRATRVCSSMPSLANLSDLHAQLGMNS